MKSVKELMSSYLEIIPASESVQHAAGRMRAYNIGCLLVRDGPELVGMITDRDITVRVAAKGKDARQTTVGEAMSPGLISCHELQSPEDVARTMEVHQLHRLPLLDDDGHARGIVSLGDLARNGFEDLVARILIGHVQSVTVVAGSPWLR